MAVELPAKFRPKIKTTLQQLLGTTVDYSQDGTPFLRETGRVGVRASVYVDGMTHADAVELMEFFEYRRAERIAIPLCTGEVVGFIDGDPDFTWIAPNAMAAAFEVVGE